MISKAVKNPLDEAAQITTRIATSPAALLSSGNLAFASQTAGEVGIGVSAATVMATIGCEFYEHTTGKKLGLPFYVLSGVNAVTALSVIEKAGIENVLNFSHDALTALLPAGAFSAWAVGHGLSGYYEATKKEPGNPIVNQQVWYGAGDLAAVQGYSWSAACFGLGLCRALLSNDTNANEDPEKKEAPSIAAFLKNQIVPSRLYGLGYVVGAVASLQDPSMALTMASAQALWGAGYLAMDKTRNQEIMRSARDIIENSIQYLVNASLKSSINKSEPIPIIIAGQGQELGDTLINIIMDVANISDKVKSLLHFGQSSDELLRNVTTRLVSIYQEVNPESKKDVFAVLEVLATRTNSAREAIMKLSDQGDPLAIEKRNRLMKRILGLGSDDDKMGLFKSAAELAAKARDNGIWTDNDCLEYLSFCYNTLTNPLTSRDVSHPNFQIIEQAKKITDRLFHT